MALFEGSMSVVSLPKSEKHLLITILEDSKYYREDLSTRLEQEGFIVLIAPDESTCLQNLQYGCDAFALDVDMGGGDRKTEGLQTLRALKRKKADCFCAIVTGKQSYTDLAKRFGANEVLSKDEAAYDQLLDSLNRQFFNRELGVTNPDSVREIGRSIRHKLENDASTLATKTVTELREAVSIISRYIEQGEFATASRELVLIGPYLKTLISYGQEAGDTFAITAHSLHHAIRNHIGQELTEEQWKVWMSVLDTLPEAQSKETNTALDQVDRLEDVGFNIEPERWRELTEAFQDEVFQDSDANSNEGLS